MYKWEQPEESDKDLRLNEDQVKDDASPLEVLEPFPLDVETDHQNKAPKNGIAKRFLELTGQGYKAHEAAKLMGSTIKGLVGNDAFKRQVQQLIETASLSADLRKEMLRAGLNRIFMENVSNPDKESQKLAIEAAKVIGSDPDVGLNAQPQAGIQINLNTLSTVLDKIDVIDIKPIEEK